jgi:hypothetical protein
MPYNYVGGADNTVSFEQAPAVRMARDFLHKRLHAALGEDSESSQAEFNEVLRFVTLSCLLVSFLR